MSDEKRSGMYWNGHDMNGWGWFTMSIAMVLLWALLITVAVLVYRSLNNASMPPQTPTTPPPDAGARTATPRLW